MGRRRDVWLGSMNMSGAGCLHGADEIGDAFMETNGWEWMGMAAGDG